MVQMNRRPLGAGIDGLPEGVILTAKLQRQLSSCKCSAEVILLLPETLLQYQIHGLKTKQVSFPELSLNYWVIYGIID